MTKRPGSDGLMSGAGDLSACRLVHAASPGGPLMDLQLHLPRPECSKGAFANYVIQWRGWGGSRARLGQTKSVFVGLILEHKICRVVFGYLQIFVCGAPKENEY